jgi:hypothetical protein
LPLTLALCWRQPTGTCEIPFHFRLHAFVSVIFPPFWHGPLPKLKVRENTFKAG